VAIWAAHAGVPVWTFKPTVNGSLVLASRQCSWLQKAALSKV
jgi:hypothetical protein